MTQGGSMLGIAKLEDTAMLIIANAGAARSSAFGAMEAAKQRDFDSAEKQLVESDEFALTAHKAHSELLQMDANGEVPGVDLLLSHCQDHLMNAVLAKEMITEFVGLYRIVDKLGG